MTIGETTMKIYKWVPISEPKKKLMSSAMSSNSSMNSTKNDNKENSSAKPPPGFEDSNTCFSDIQGDFVSTGMPFSEDSNSQGSESLTKRLKSD